MWMICFEWCVCVCGGGGGGGSSFQKGPKLLSLQSLTPHTLVADLDSINNLTPFILIPTLLGNFILIIVVIIHLFNAFQLHLVV
jgi:hypothetical protein